MLESEYEKLLIKNKKKLLADGFHINDKGEVIKKEPYFIKLCNAGNGRKFK